MFSIRLSPKEQDRARRVAEHLGLSVGALFRRQEVGSVDDDKWRWRKWIAPRIGAKPSRDVTPDDIEDIRDTLSDAVKAYEAAGNGGGEGRLAAHTAANVWAALTTPMKYASTRKGPRELRVREDLATPAPTCRHRVTGQASGDSGCADQFRKFIACKRIPVEWRTAYAVGLSLHLRPGELHALRISDLDIAAGEVRIGRAFDERTKTVTTPKTDEGVRSVTMPATLVPLLEYIARNGAPTDRVCPIVAATQEKNRAGIYREHLQCADIDHAPF